MAVNAYVLIQTEVGKAANVAEQVEVDPRCGVGRRRDGPLRRHSARRRPRPSTSSVAWWSATSSSSKGSLER